MGHIQSSGVIGIHAVASNRNADERMWNVGHWASLISQLNEDGDVNLGVHAPSKDYDIILFSEIIEHLMNPLGAMQDCYKLLKPGRICVVSTPIASRLSFQSPHHFAEYKPDRMRKKTSDDIHNT